MNNNCCITEKNLITINNDFGDYYWKYCYYRGLADYAEKYDFNQNKVESWRECQGYYHTKYTTIEITLMTLGLDEYLPNIYVRQQYRGKAEIQAVVELGLAEEEGLI